MDSMNDGYGKIIIFDRNKPNYRLIIKKELGEKQKGLPSDMINFQVFGDHNVRLVSCRHMSEYGLIFPNLPLDSGLKYVEVGAGLGELVPYITERIKTRIKPTVIDPADYQTIYSLLKDSTKADITKPNKKFIRELMERCEIINDADKVRLFNTTLENVLEENPSLVGFADVVVDLFGAAHYTLNFERTWNQLASITKKGGRVFTPN